MKYPIIIVIASLGAAIMLVSLCIRILKKCGGCDNKACTDYG